LFFLFYTILQTKLSFVFLVVGGGGGGGGGGGVKQRVGEHRLKAGMGPMGLLKSDFNSNE